MKQKIIHSLVFFGECMVEHRANGSLFFGGDTFNTAWYLRQLIGNQSASNLAIYYATGLGPDGHSDTFRALMQSLDISDDYCVTDEVKELGQYWVETNDKGERSFRFDRENSAARNYFELPQRLTDALINRDFDAIYLSGISLAILAQHERAFLVECLRSFKEKGGVIIFDNNYRPVLWGNSKPITDYFNLMSLADIAFLTDEDEYAVYGTRSVADIVDLHFKGTTEKQLLVIRQGANPCVVKPADNEKLLYVSATAVDAKRVVDTCAAGDSFAAGYLAKWLRNENAQCAASFGHKVAATVIQHHGALIPSHYITELTSTESLDVQNFY